nr:lipopolysaccharide biosynthesis protein [Oxalobacteraceae bacterium]
MLKLSIVYLLVRVINGVLSVAALYVLSRALTGEEYGRYVLVTAAATLVAVSGFQWINVAVSRFHARFADREGSILAEALTLYSWMAIPVLALMSAFLVVRVGLEQISVSTILIVTAGAFALAAHALGLQVANARQTPGLYGAITVARGGFGLLLAWFLVQQGCSWQGAILGFVIAAVISVGFLAFNLRGARLQRAPPIRHEMIRYGLPLSLTFLVSIVLELAGRFIVGVSLGEASAGGYAAGYDLVQQLIGATLNALFLAAFPAIVRLYEAGGVDRAAEKMRELLKYFILVTPLVLGFFYGLSPQIAAVVFGSSIRDDAAQVMPIVATAVWIGGFKSYYLDIAFQLKKKTKIQWYTTALMAAVSVVLALLLVRIDGVRGVAYAAVAAYLSGAMASYIVGRREGLYSIRPRDVFGLLLLVGLVTVAARIGASAAPTASLVSLVAGGALAAVTYACAALVFNVAGCRGAAISFLRRRG